MALRQASLAGIRASAALRREAARRRSKGNPSTFAGLGSGHAAVVGVGSSRHIHPSGRKEMLPVIGGALAVAAVATGLRYLIRAGGSMFGLVFIVLNTPIYLPIPWNVATA